jgi:very-short-patch-repair endonuclease
MTESPAERVADLTPADLTETLDVSGEESPRAQRIRLTARRWADSLIDMSGANRLVYYRDLKVGTLDLATARPAAVTALLAGQARTISDLFPEPDKRADAMKRMRAIRSKVRELSEERGLDAGYLALGLATWHEPERAPRSPVLLHALKISATSAIEADFTLRITGEPEVNPVLLHRLAHDFGVHIGAEEVLADSEAATPELEAEQAYENLAKLATRVPGFAIMPATVVGTFVYEKLPMVQDINQGTGLLALSDVAAALAGDTSAARDLVSLEGVDVDEPDHIALRDEYIVLDADSSQSRAINAVVAGQHLVVKGPPGTGKSQTIANLIATLAARGQTALFVAEKRAAIDAVVDRLASVGLDDLVQNLHGGATSRRELAGSLQARLMRVSEEHQPHLTDLGTTLVARREQMSAHDEAMHRVHSPWGISVFEAQSRLLGVGADAVTPARWFGEGLEALDRDRAGQLRDNFAEAARLGLFDPSLSTGAWDAITLTDPQAARDAMFAATELSQRQLPELRRMVAQVAAECGVRTPSTVAESRDMLTLTADTTDLARRLKPEVYSAPVPDYLAAAADRAWRKDHHVTMGFFARRAQRRAASALFLTGTPNRADMFATLSRVMDVSQRWTQWNVDGRPPRPSPSTPAALAALAAAEESLARVPVLLHADVTLDQLHRQADALASDAHGLDRAVRRNGLQLSLRQWRADRLLDELTDRQADADLAVRAFDYAWLTSVLDTIRAGDPSLRGFDGAVLHAAADQFRDADADHIRHTPARVRRAAAAHLVAVLDRYREEQDLVRREAAKKTRHLPTRQLFERAPHALLAIKPCWAMSPLLVSQVLPAQRLFDVVIFDEASQVLPVDGITAIMRGRQVVVAGDEHQLPPTAFFDRVDSPVEAGDEEEAYTDDVESLLQAYSSVLPLPQVTHLAWHYRSRDERLIAFSNAQIYSPHGNELVTFPGGTVGTSLTHVLVQPGKSTSAVAEESVGTEVHRVVELILEHAETRPAESLGVITMGIKHADRIDTALRRALALRADLHRFFGERAGEPFFIKNIERVQGDERDAIILSVGYGPGPDGRMLYRFGPLNVAGGQRRLNVAITRARRRMTVVSSFSSSDLDPRRLKADGARMLRSYLEYAEAQMTGGPSVPAGSGPANPFESDVMARLTAAGIPLIGQYGVGGHRIDFAATHPDDPTKLVLAIEADGRTYHSSPTARDRDRLRQEHLERLGWRYHRIWSTDWFHNRDAEVERAVEAYQDAVASGAELQVEPAIGTAIVPPARTAPRPDFEPGLPITEYPDDILVGVMRWVESDGRLRTEDEVLTESMDELGFTRRGPRIVETLRQAIVKARRP